MPYSDDNGHSPSEFYHPGETNDPNIYIRLKVLAAKADFLVFSTKLKQTAIQESHEKPRAILSRTDITLN